MCLHLPSLLFKSEREIREENKKEEATASADLNLNFSTLLFSSLLFSSLPHTLPFMLGVRCFVSKS